MGKINSTTPYVFEEGEDKAIENLMDLYTKIVPLNDNFYFDNYLRPVVSQNYPEFKEHHRLLSDKARRLMKTFDYLYQETPTYQKCHLTLFGREVQLAGGHYKYLETKEVKQKIADKKDHADYITSKVSANTGWIIAIVTIISVIVGIIAVF